MKRSATELLCSASRFVGAAVEAAVAQSGLPDLLARRVLDALREAPFDPALAAQYPSPAGAAPPTRETRAPAGEEPEAAAFDATSEVKSGKASEEKLQPLVAAMGTQAGKESWKERQRAIEATTALMERHARVAGNRAVGAAMASLKERLGESNLNLRTRALVCVGAIARAVGRDVAQWSALLLPELMKLCAETKPSLLDALCGCAARLSRRFAALTRWVEHPPFTAALFNSVLPFLPQGLRAVKGRLLLLRWANQYRELIDARQAPPLVSPLLDCLTDRVSGVRVEAAKTVQVLARLCAPQDFDRAMKGRPSPDVQALRAFLDPLLQPRAAEPSANRSKSPAKNTTKTATANSANIPNTLNPNTPYTPNNPNTPNNTNTLNTNTPTSALAETPSGETPASARQAEFEQRKKSLALRPGVRLLSKPKAGEGLKARYSHAKSSIPKPMPRLSVQRRSVESAFAGSFLNPPSERSSILSLSNASIFLSYPVVPRGSLHSSNGRSWSGRKPTRSGM